MEFTKYNRKKAETFSIFEGTFCEELVMYYVALLIYKCYFRKYKRYYYNSLRVEQVKL